MRRFTHTLACAICSVMLTIGCADKNAAKPQTDTKAHSEHKEGEKHEHSTATAATEKHDHSGWWCNEHGVPEEVCALCNSKVAADFQKKGDWCKEHDRPDSQCFKCHPELEAQFAAKYEAKYGKQPPKPELN